MTHSQNFIFLSGVYELFPELSVSTIRRIIEPILSDESNKELIYRRNNSDNHSAIAIDKSLLPEISLLLSTYSLQQNVLKSLPNNKASLKKIIVDLIFESSDSKITIGRVHSLIQRLEND